MSNSVDDELKKISNTLNEKTQNFATAERRKAVNLLSSDFEDILEPRVANSIKLEESDYITNVMVIVPSNLEQGNFYIIITLIVVIYY